MNHGLSGVAGERCAELGHVADYAIHAITSVGMGIGLRAQTGSFRPDVLAPELSVAQEEALLRRESVHLGLRLAVQRLHEGHKRQMNAAIVGRVFAERELAVEMDVVHGSER